MKKIIIAALVMMLVCSASVFAVYNNSNIKDYAGLNVSFSYVYDTYKVGESSEIVDKAGQLGIGFSDFTFFGDVSLGLYADGNAIFTIKDNDDNNDDSKSPLYLNFAVGLGFKRDLNSKMMLLGAAGLDFIFFTRQSTYYVVFDHYTVDRTYVTMGVFADVEVAYKLARDVYFTLGAKGNLNFLKWVTIDSTNYSGSHTSTTTKDTEGYFGYRITPKVGVYIVF